MDVVLNVAPDDLGWIRANQPEALHTGPIHATYLLVLNVARKPLDDVRVRRALSLAIDRDAIANQLLKTGVRPAWSFVSPGIGGYPGLTPPEEGMPAAKRVAEARRLLDEAGYGPDNPLTLPLVYDTQEENRKIMVAIGSMWQAIGVRAEISNVEFGALLGALRTKNYAVVRSSTFSLYDDPMAFLQQFGSQSPTNWAGWTNPRYDQLLHAVQFRAGDRRRRRDAHEAAAGRGGAAQRRAARDPHLLLPGQGPRRPPRQGLVGRRHRHAAVALPHRWSDHGTCRSAFRRDPMQVAPEGAPTGAPGLAPSWRPTRRRCSAGAPRPTRPPWIPSWRRAPSRRRSSMTCSRASSARTRR